VALVIVIGGVVAWTQLDRQVDVLFTIRDGEGTGPTLGGAELQLRYLADDGAAPAVLGRGTSDSQGRAKMAVRLTAAQKTCGSFEVLITAGSTSKTCKLPAFPQTCGGRVNRGRSRPRDVVCHERLGGLSNHQELKAA
jgi:hypothetical protein